MQLLFSRRFTAVVFLVSKLFKTDWSADRQLTGELLTLTCEKCARTRFDFPQVETPSYTRQILDRGVQPECDIRPRESLKPSGTGNNAQTEKRR